MSTESQRIMGVQIPHPSQTRLQTCHQNRFGPDLGFENYIEFLGYVVS